MRGPVPVEWAAQGRVEQQRQATPDVEPIGGDVQAAPVAFSHSKDVELPDEWLGDAPRGAGLADNFKPGLLQPYCPALEAPRRRAC